MKSYPAIEVRCDSTDLLLAAVDDFAPTAIEERGGSVRVFFSTADARDAARVALGAAFPVEAIDVPDENWARRSQESLTPITVGRITVAPPWPTLSQPPAPGHGASATSHPASARRQRPRATARLAEAPEARRRQPPATALQPPALSPQPSALVITIQPSMGFGTGHHATTRLCLEAMQAIDLTGLVLLDVGTGSGVLAIAGARLGAARAIGIDVDPDAIQSARENLAMNPDARSVSFEVADLTSAALPAVQVVTANLTGALLVKSAHLLLGAVEPGGVLILSGLLVHERDEVCRAFAPAAVCWARQENEWVGLAVKKP